MFTDSERLFFSEMGGLVRDEQGREVLIGLTHEETQFYLEHTRARSAGRPDGSRDNKKRFLELYNKYQARRLEALGYEIARKAGLINVQ